MFLALHGQTEWNRDGRVQGQLDSPLTEHGRRQAVTAARILGGQSLVPGTFEIVCSPLGRTRETARIIAAELGFDISAIRSDERLREVSLGQWDGHTRAEIEARWPEGIAEAIVTIGSFAHLTARPMTTSRDGSAVGSRRKPITTGSSS